MIRQMLLAGAVSLLCAGPAYAASGDLNDLEIAHAAYTAGEIDIRYAHLALALADDPEIRAFAQTMERDHAAVNKAAADLLAKLKATPQDNALSQSLSSAASSERAKLKALSGEAFDKAYAANELAYHRAVNAALAETLIPSTENAELKALLTTALNTFRAHEKHAAQLAEAHQ